VPIEETHEIQAPGSDGFDRVNRAGGAANVQ
jgi:hypothetical protein